MIECRVDGTIRTGLYGIGFGFVKLFVFGDGERLGLFEEVLALGRHFEHTIIVDVFLKIAGYEGLVNDGIPNAL